MVFNKSEKDMYISSRKSMVFIITLLLIIMMYVLNTIGVQYMNKIHIGLNRNKASALEDNISKDPKNVLEESKEHEKNIVMRTKKFEDGTEMSKVSAIIKNDEKINISNDINTIEKTTQPSSFKEIFKDDIFLGDSITKGLAEYNFLEDQNVHAKIGISTLKVNDLVDEAIALKPKNVYILCGINDMDGTLNKARFTSHYRQLVRNVKGKLPGSKVYVQSILPISARAEENAPYIKNSQISEYNEIIKEIARSENVNYININSIVNDANENLHEPDGIHFKASFYPLWLNYLKNSIK